MSVNPRLKTNKIIGQRKEFFRQRMLESSCEGKETVDINILVTYRNGSRKIMQSTRVKRVELPWEKRSETSWASSEEHLPK